MAKPQLLEEVGKVSELKTNDMFFMNVREDMKISLSEKNKQYMKYHRNNIFIN